jgi:hypothetical protein
VVRGLWGDGDGHVFVVPELEDVPAGTAIDVFRESGEYLGRMDLPAPMSVAAPSPVALATADRLYYVAADEADVPYVVGFTIRRTE